MKVKIGFTEGTFGSRGPLRSNRIIPKTSKMNELESQVSFELSTVTNGHLCEKFEPLKVREILLLFKVLTVKIKEIHEMCSSCILSLIKQELIVIFFHIFVLIVLEKLRGTRS